MDTATVVTSPRCSKNKKSIAGIAPSSILYTLQEGWRSLDSERTKSYSTSAPGWLKLVDLDFQGRPVIFTKNNSLSTLQIEISLRSTENLLPTATAWLYLELDNRKKDRNPERREWF